MLKNLGVLFAQQYKMLYFRYNRSDETDLYFACIQPVPTRIETAAQFVFKNIWGEISACKETWLATHLNASFPFRGLIHIQKKLH